MTVLQELMPDEKAKPYAKYYRKPVDPDAELMKLVRRDKPMDPSKALMPENINDLLNPGYMEVETGWCNLPNGAGYICVNNKMPGVTVEMLDWWFAWHALASLHYKIWFPPGHYGITTSIKDRQKILDPKVPIKQKIYGVTHHVVEDVGMGKEDIFIYFCSPEEMGFDMSRFKSPNVEAVYGGHGLSTPAGAPPTAIKAPAIMCHFIRAIPGGIEFRTRFWMGYTLVDRKPVFMLPYGIKVPEDAVHGLAQHNVEEYSNFRVMLPLIYKEQKGLIP